MLYPSNQILYSEIFSNLDLCIFVDIEFAERLQFPGFLYLTSQFCFPLNKITISTFWYPNHLQKTMHIVSHQLQAYFAL